MKKPPSRAKRWSAAVAKIQAAIDEARRALDNGLEEGVAELEELKEEFENWKDNLPENLSQSPLGEKLETVVLKDTRNRQLVPVTVDRCFYFIGYLPATELFQGQLALTERGYIPTNTRMQTNLEGVFAAGDVRQTCLRQVAPAVGDGAIAGLEAERYIAELEVYEKHLMQREMPGMIYVYSAIAEPVAVYDVKKLQGSMDKIQRSILWTEASVKAYLDLIGKGQATSTQLNEISAFLLRRGVPNLAAEFQHAATEVSPDVPALWVNLGTIEQARGKSGNAKSAYKKALELDPTNGMGYYGLGVVADGSGEYEEAIERYRRALLIDPSLADPRVNPQVVNNARLLVVKLLLSQDRAGAMSLPLLPPGE